MHPQRTGNGWHHQENDPGERRRKTRTEGEVLPLRHPPGQGPIPLRVLPKRYQLALLAGLRGIQRRPIQAPTFPQVPAPPQPPALEKKPPADSHAPAALSAPSDSPAPIPNPEAAVAVKSQARRRADAARVKTVLAAPAMLVAMAVLVGTIMLVIWNEARLDTLRQELRTSHEALNTARAALHDAHARMDQAGDSGAGNRTMAALQEEWRGRLDAEVERLEAQGKALRSDLNARLTSEAPLRKDFPGAFARARNALLFIRTDYRIRLLLTDEERTLTGFGTGFFITPGGVALTARHVLFPWEYDRTLQASLAAGVVERIPGSTRISAWPTGTRVTRPEGGSDSDEADFLFQHAYRSDGDAPQVTVLRLGLTQTTAETVGTPLGPVEVNLPNLGRGDWALFQVRHPGKRFHYLRLARRDHALAVLDDVMVVGYPLSRLLQGMAEPQPSQGRVRRTGTHVLELDSPLHPGNSGGPVLDAQGNVLGLASAVLDSPVYGIAVPARELRQAWNGLRAEISAEQRRLKAQGCDPGSIDGIPGPATHAARRCLIELGIP